MKTLVNTLGEWAIIGTLLYFGYTGAACAFLFILYMTFRLGCLTYWSGSKRLLSEFSQAELNNLRIDIEKTLPEDTFKGTWKAACASSILGHALKERS